MEKKQKIHKVFLNPIKYIHEHSIYIARTSYSQKKKKKNQKKTNEKPSPPPGEELHHIVGESVIVQ